MKQELTAFVWPALVGVLAAALILDKWVLEPQETLNLPVNGGYRNAVALATPSVVNIYTAKLVDARTDPRLNSPLQRRLLSNRGSRQRIELRSIVKVSFFQKILEDFQIFKKTAEIEIEP